MIDLDYWQRQSPEKPLFEDLLWSRPENKNLAGKLVIVGGNLHGFAKVAASYNEALKAGVGQVKVLLPDALAKTVGKLMAEAEFLPSTKSGGFAGSALAGLLEASAWADVVLLAGDFGKNSETVVLLEKFLLKYKGAACLVDDAIDPFLEQTLLINRPKTTLVLNISQLQKLAGSAQFEQAFTYSMGLVQMVERLHDFTLQHPLNIVIMHLSSAIVASGGKVSSTKLDTQNAAWLTKTAAQTSVWWLQNPSKVFEALTTAIYECYH